MTSNFSLDEIVLFMQEIGIEFLNPYGVGELIISEKEGIFMSLDGLSNMKEVEARYIQAVSRPIGKSLPENKAELLLSILNSYFGSSLSREDMRNIYTYLAYRETLKATEFFIADGFPMDKLKDCYGRKE
ncbi:hypothetical protein [Bacillus phage SDFMU_Pbc]|uniref:Uncharacterized protein n=1 Tax=Bacillus phage SDFMU_Pbc TaxID=3076135 RepID=A0AA96R2U6_9CAUD|nr:hypothetical protein [Bacillus phage SDFMU_Pbc]